MVEVGTAHSVEPALVPVFADMLDQLHEQVLIHILAHDVLVRPERHGFGEGPGID